MVVHEFLEMKTVIDTMIRLLELQHYHYAAVKAIYELGIATRMATLETKAPDWEKWDKDHLAVCRTVAIDGDRVLSLLYQVGACTTAWQKTVCMSIRIMQEKVWAHFYFQI